MPFAKYSQQTTKRKTKEKLTVETSATYHDILKPATTVKVYKSNMSPLPIGPKCGQDIVRLPVYTLQFHQPQVRGFALVAPDIFIFGFIYISPHSIHTSYQ